MKSKLTIALMIGTLVTTSLFGDTNANLRTKQTLEGVVTPMVTMDIKYGLDQMYKGFIDYVMPAGTFFTGPVYDANGKLIKSGDILATINPDYAQLQYQVALTKLASAKASFDNKRTVFESNKQIVEKNPQAVSRNAYVASESEYLQAKADYEQASANAQMTKKILDDVCTLRARFAGVVNEVKFSGGWAQGLPATLNVSQMNPIFIKIPLDRMATVDFNYNTPVTVYPNKAGGKPVGFLQGRTTFKDNSLMILVYNEPLPPPVDLSPINGKKIPILKTWCPIIPFSGLKGGQYFEDETLIVSVKSLFGKEGDYYVWLVEDAKTAEPGVGMNYLNKVKKVPVETDGKILSVPSFVGMITFTPKEGDRKDHVGAILLSNKDCPEDLQDGDTVCLYAGMYTFMPGEKVKVDIGPTPATVK